MMQKIIENCTGHDLKDVNFSKCNDFVCTSCVMGKLILRPSLLKIHIESLKFLERIQGDMRLKSYILFHMSIHKMV
jgi:hypothetical protein